MKSYWLAFAYLSFFFCGSLYAQEKDRSTSFFSKNPEDLYLGALMSLKSINSEKHVIKDFSFKEQLNTFSFDIKYEFAPFVPTKQNMYAAIEREFKRVGAPGDPPQVVSRLGRSIPWMSWTFDSVKIWI